MTLISDWVSPPSLLPPSPPDGLISTHPVRCWMVAVHVAANNSDLHLLLDHLDTINSTATPDRLLVLGAGSAIARSTVEQLTARGTSSLVLACRHPRRLDPWLEVLRHAHPALEVTTLSFDTTDVEGRRYANEVALRGLRVDALTALSNHQEMAVQSC